MQCCGPNRSFEIRFTDNLNQEIMRIIRPLRLGCRCCPCGLQELEIQAPPGNPIGYVIQR